MDKREELLNLIFVKKSKLDNLKYKYSGGEIGTLFYLYDNNGTSQSDIAKFLGFSMPRIAKIINTLEEKGYIIRALDSDDKRKTIIIITDKGKDMVREKREYLLEIIDSITDNMSYEDINKYIELSNKIDDII